MKPELTVGMAVYRDFDGVYFTVQALRLHQDMDGVELVVVDNFGCDATREFVEGWARGRYVRFTAVVGTAAPRDCLFWHARGKAVLCLDSHVLLAPGVLARLKRYYRDHPRTADLLQGPLLYDDLHTLASHFDPTWRDGMWGAWAIDERAEDPAGEPFEIPMQGLGLFSCRKAAWPGFNPHFRGFGGEEGYIHEKFRRLGRRCLCLPWLRWVHRFQRPGGVPYRLDLGDRIVNYLIGHRELGLDEAPVREHFREHQVALAEALAEADKRGACGVRRAARTQGAMSFSPHAPRPTPHDFVSCLLPTYNAYPDRIAVLEESVESFLRQDHPHKELILCNDTPGQELAFDHPQVRVFNLGTRFPNLGCKIAWMIAQARGDVLCRWDDDDVSLPWRLAVSHRRLGQAMHWAPHTFWYDNGRLSIPDGPACSHMMAIWRRGLLDRIGGYPVDYDPHTSHEDMEFDRLVKAAGLHCERPRLRPAELFYVYRWNNGVFHLSGCHDGSESWEAIGRRPVTPGVFRIRPRWLRDWVGETRNALRRGVSQAMS
jgi:glycosyltransferase involved in cell wall biosynthesis